MTSKGYCTADEVITLLALDAEDASVRTRVEFMIPFAESCVDEHCRTIFQWEENVTKYFNGTGTTMITLGRFLRRLGSVSYGTYGVEDSWTPCENVYPQPEPPSDGQGYRWVEMARSPVSSFQGSYFGVTEPLSAIFRPGLKNIKIVGDWGFRTEEMPNQVKLAVAYTVKYMFDLADFNPMIKLHSGLGRTVEYFAGASEMIMPPFAKMILSGLVNSRAMADTIYDAV